MPFAYLHAKPDVMGIQGIFYVGKGNQLKRCRKMSRRNKYHTEVVKEYGKSNILVGVMECSTEDIAFELERGLIKCLLKSGVSLCNLSRGGEGPSGIPSSSLQKARMREINQAFTHEQRSEARKKEPPETNLRRSESMKKKHASRSDEEKQNSSRAMSRGQLSSWSDPEIRARRIQGMRGKKKTMTPEAMEARRQNALKRK